MDTATHAPCDLPLSNVLTDVPPRAGCRWFVRRGSETPTDRGFRSKAEASSWIESLGRRIDWRVGFLFRLRGDTLDIEIVDRHGQRAQP